MKKLRELFSDTLIYGISSVAARFINYLLVPFHTDVFNPARYGIIGLIYAAIALLNVIFTFGMESAYLRYAADRKEAATIFKTIQISLLVLATLLCGVLWVAMPVLLPLLSLGPDNSALFVMMLGILWFDTLSIVPMAELRLTRRALLFASIKTLHVIINIVLNFWLILGMGFGIEAVFIANLAASMLMTFVVWAFTADLLRGGWNRRWLKTLFEFGWPFVPSGIGYAINEMLDRFLLNGMDPANAERLYGMGTTPEDVVGIYNACYKMAVFMLLLVQMYRMAWQPFFMRHAKERESPLLFAQAFIWFNLFAALLFLGVALFREQIVAIQIPLLDVSLIGSGYWAGLDIVPWLLLAYWFHGWYINFSAGIFIREKTRALYKITLMGAGVTILANLMLIPLYGMTGSAVATLLSYGAMALVLGRYSRQVMEVPYPLKQSLLLMLFLGGLVFAEPTLQEFTGTEMLTKMGLSIAGIFVILLYAIQLRKKG